MCTLNPLPSICAPDGQLWCLCAPTVYATCTCRARCSPITPSPLYQSSPLVRATAGVVSISVWSHVLFCLLSICPCVGATVGVVSVKFWGFGVALARGGGGGSCVNAGSRAQQTHLLYTRLKWQRRLRTFLELALCLFHLLLNDTIIILCMNITDRHIDDRGRSSWMLEPFSLGLGGLGPCTTLCKLVGCTPLH